MINKHYEAIHRYDFLTKDLLEEEYIKNGLTDKQIAEKYKMPSKTVVWRKRKNFGIENKFKKYPVIYYQTFSLTSSTSWGYSETAYRLTIV